MVNKMKWEKNDKDWGIVACLTTGEGGDWRGDRLTLC